MYFSDFCVNLLIRAFLKFCLGKGNLDGNRQLYIYIIYPGRELFMRDRVVCSLLLGKRVVTTPFAERHFSGVLWPLAGEVRRITCSFIALALNIRVCTCSCVVKLKVQFCTQRKRFEECAQNWTFHVGRAKASLWLRRSRKFALRNVGGSEWVRSQNRHCALRCKVGMDCMNLVSVISRYTRAVRSGAAGAARAAPLFVAKLVIYSKSS